MEEEKGKAPLRRALPRRGGAREEQEEGEEEEGPLWVRYGGKY